MLQHIYEPLQGHIFL